MNRNILVLYHLSTLSLRPSQLERLYAFRNYARDRCIYVNLDLSGVPPLLGIVRFDVVVFDTSFLDRRRSGTSAWEQILRRAEIVKQWGGVRIALPQDECNHTDRLRDFVNSFAIDKVFSVAQPSQWPIIYAGVDFTRTEFHRVLTGYLDTESLHRIESMGRTTNKRPVDIGYRAAYRPQWGRFGLCKVELAQLFASQAPLYGLTSDISTDSNDFFLGDDWYQFLLNCKYIPGVESGGSLLDRDGSITTRIRHYVDNHPRASFGEVEQFCFPGLDNGVDLRALGPRHLEACVTRTCQILIEGEYNGVLHPWSHYIPLKADFSNIDDVMRTIKDDKLRSTIVETAYRDIVESGKYTYERYVQYVLEHVQPSEQKSQTTRQMVNTRFAYILANSLEATSHIVLRAKDMIMQIVPDAFLDMLRQIKNRNFRE